MENALSLHTLATNFWHVTGDKTRPYENMITVRLFPHSSILDKVQYWLHHDILAFITLTRAYARDDGFSSMTCYLSP